MLIQDIEKKHEPFNVASGLAATLIAQGSHVQYVRPPATRPENKTKWRAMLGAGAPGPQYPPLVDVRCGNCKNAMQIEGKPAFVQTKAFRHCPASFQIAETIPADVLAAYTELYNNYFKTNERPTEPGFIRKLAEVF